MCGYEVELFVGGITNKTCIQDIKSFFYKYTSIITSVKLFQGFAFVRFRDDSEVDNAVYHLNNKSLRGKLVTVERRTAGDRDGNSRFPRRKESSCEPEDNCNYRLKVSNLAETVSWRELKDFMQQVGGVVYTDAHRFHSHMGVVHFAKRRHMLRALATLDGEFLHQRRIHLHSPKMIPNKFIHPKPPLPDPYAERHRFNNRPYLNGPDHHIYNRNFQPYRKPDVHQTDNYHREQFCAVSYDQYRDQELGSKSYSRTYSSKPRFRSSSPATYPREVHYPPKDDHFYRKPSYESYKKDPRRSRTPKRYSSPAVSPPEKRARPLEDPRIKSRDSKSKKNELSLRSKESSIRNPYATFMSRTSTEMPTLKSVIIRPKEMTQERKRSPHKEFRGPRTPSYTPPRELAPVPSKGTSSSKPLGNALASSSPAKKRKSRSNSSFCSCTDCRPRNASSPSSSSSSSSSSGTSDDQKSPRQSSTNQLDTSKANVLQLAVEENSLVQNSDTEAKNVTLKDDPDVSETK